MNKPLDQFAGWLRFFWVAACISIVVSLFEFFASFGSFIDIRIGLTESQRYTNAVFQICNLVLMAVFIKKLPIRQEFTPRFILKLVNIGLVLSLVHTALMRYLSAEGFANSLIVPVGVWWWIAILLYMQKSKRVKAFYGCNAIRKSKISLEEEDAVASGLLKMFGILSLIAIVPLAILILMEIFG